jgi:hypothetical protein
MTPFGASMKKVSACPRDLNSQPVAMAIWFWSTNIVDTIGL